MLLLVPFVLLKGRLRLKSWLAEHVSIDPAAMPWNEALLAHVRSEKANGRRIVLATAAHKSIAHSLAKYLNLFDDVLATDDRVNLKASAKLSAIESLIRGPFVYAGDSRADHAVWKGAEGAISIGIPPEEIHRRAGRKIPIELYQPRSRVRISELLRAFRVHQWVKNVLLFVPALTAFSFLDPGRLAAVLLGFLSFSLVASATYLVNDLLDLASDRQHPRKRNRPMASGRLSIPNALVLMALLGVGGALLALQVSFSFLLVLAGYVVTTLAYSLHLKQYVLLDVIGLAVLYTIRIGAGAVALNVALSPWLMAFSMFLFLSLALVKRCAELVSLRGEGKDATVGRDYREGDLVVLWPLGVGAALVASLVFGLFIVDPSTQDRFAHPAWLWGVASLLVYWLGRLWIKTARGTMHDDPVVYAFADRGSRTTILAIVFVFIVARLGLPG